MSLIFSGLVITTGAISADGVFHGHVPSSKPRAPVVTSAIGTELVQQYKRDLPPEFDWRNVGGRSFATADLNQHLPEYCGSCWIHGVTSALNDRLKVMRNAQFPDVMLARQVMINCVEQDGKRPECEGGDAWAIYEYLHKHPIPDESCAAYIAKNDECTPYNTCRQCLPEEKIFPEWSTKDLPTDEKGCYPMKHYTRYSVSQFGNVSGMEDMMSEIFARGPITCSFAVDATFLVNYATNSLQNEGVYVQEHAYNASMVNHDVEVAGWGETPGGIKYWVVRNSWGTFWGQNGWFKVERGANQLMLESDCSWAVPEFDELSPVLGGLVLGDYLDGLKGGSMHEMLGLSVVPQTSTLAAIGGFIVAFSSGITVAWFAFRPRRSFQHEPTLLG